MIIDLPTPPSTNHLYRRSRGNVYKTAKYREWEVAASLVIQLERPGSFDVPVSLEIRVQYAPRRDLDNYLKPICDILVKNGVIENDRMTQVLEKRIVRDDAIEGVRVIIEPMNN